MEVDNTIVCGLDAEVAYAHMLWSRTLTDELECVGRNESTWVEVGHYNTLVAQMNIFLNLRQVLSSSVELNTERYIR